MLTYKNLKEVFQREINYKITQIQVDKINLFYQLLIEYNKHTNLTTILNENDFLYKHLIDSAFIFKFIELKGKIADCGSGAGFPGIILKILNPSLNIYLIESNHKKIVFLELVIKKLNLKNIHLINDRIENLLDLRESFDYILARALAPLNQLIELTSYLVKINGFACFYKGPNYQNELKDLNLGYQKLGFNKYQSYNYYIDNNQRFLLIFNKTSSTSSLYPRLYHKIKKEPLH